MPSSLKRWMRFGTTSMTPSRSRKTASCSTSCVRAAAVAAGGLATATPRDLEGELERAFGPEREAERGGVLGGVGSGERRPGDLERRATIVACGISRRARRERRKQANAQRSHAVKDPQKISLGTTLYDTSLCTRRPLCNRTSRTALTRSARAGSDPSSGSDQIAPYSSYLLPCSLRPSLAPMPSVLHVSRMRPEAFAIMTVWGAALTQRSKGSLYSTRRRS